MARPPSRISDSGRPAGRRVSTRFVCQSCGESFLRWEGQCRSCGTWNSLVETAVRSDRPTHTSPAGSGAGSIRLADAVEASKLRLRVGIDELDRVLGGGLVPGSLVLLGGEPGIGKSTLVLQAAAGVASALAASGGYVLYASGEESAAQVRLRAERLAMLEGPPAEAIRVLAENDVATIVETARAERPALLLVDSIQTMTVDDLDGPAGSVGQVRESALRFLELAKGDEIPVILVGHVTKDGSIAGPKTLEHLVDAVLTLEGERFAAIRVVRATKNRFGSTDEVGVFEMAARGLVEVPDPARAFLIERDDGPGPDAPGPDGSRHDHSGDQGSRGDGSQQQRSRGEAAPGSVVAATMEGSRPLLVEVQALVAPGGYGPPRRTAIGIDANRLALLIAVLGRRAGVALGTHDVYANVAGGLAVDEPALDLPLALALASSMRDRPVGADTVAVGEVGLLGELRPVAGLERRLREAARLGFRRAIAPGSRRSTAPDVPGLEVVLVSSLREALAVAIGDGDREFRPRTELPSESRTPERLRSTTPR